MRSNVDINPNGRRPMSTPTSTPTTVTGEKTDLLAALGQHRFFLRNTTTGLTDEQAALRSTVSELCLGGLIKHVAHGETQWIDFVLGGASAMHRDGKAWADWDESDYAEYGKHFQMVPDETLADILAEYERVAARTDEVVRSLPDLDASHPLPEAPWFEPGARWSARRVIVHLIAEMAQHAGHADIIREAIDGAKSMG
jgi:hypothetical protein